MTKTAVSRPAKPARRERSDYIGRTEEGLLIPRPPFRPSSFTVRELQNAIRAMREAEGRGDAEATRCSRDDVRSKGLALRDAASKAR